MKIIKAGRLPEHKKYSCTCDNCDTIFEFTINEGKRISDQRDGDYIEINCPLCAKVAHVAVHLFK